MNKNKHSIRIIFLTFGIMFGLIFGAEAVPSIWLNDLEDCYVPLPNDGDVLTYNTSSANWSSQAPIGGLSNISVLNDLTDVDTTGVQADDFLQYNGSGWNDFDLFNTANTWLQTNTFNIDVNIENDLWAQNNIYLDSDMGMLYFGETQQQGNIFHDGTNFIFTHTGRTDIEIRPLGIINFNLQSGCRVILTSGQIIPPFAWIKLNLNNIDYDNQNEWRGSPYYLFTAIERGLYQIDYSIELEWNTLGTNFKVGIFVNGVLSGGYQSMDIGISLGVAISGADCLRLNPGDMVDLRVLHLVTPSALAPSQIYTNYLAIHKLS